MQVALSGTLAGGPSFASFFGPSHCFAPCKRRVSVIWRGKSLGVRDRETVYFGHSVDYSGFPIGG